MSHSALPPGHSHSKLQHTVCYHHPFCLDRDGYEKHVERKIRENHAESEQYTVDCAWCAYCGHIGQHIDFGKCGIHVIHPFAKSFGPFTDDFGNLCSGHARWQMVYPHGIYAFLYQSGPDPHGDVEKQESCRSEHAFECGAEHHQTEHIEEQMWDPGSGVHEHVGDRLPCEKVGR